MTASGTAAVAESASRTAGGKFLTFGLAGEVYGLEILTVQEIIGLMDVARVPQVPRYVRGVINLRGRIITVVDLRLKFGLDAQEDTDKTCIVVVQVGEGDRRMTLGIIVDEVREVVDISADQIEPPPSFGSAIDTSFLLGMGKLDQRVAMLLDIDRILVTDELASVQARS